MKDGKAAILRGLEQQRMFWESAEMFADSTLSTVDSHMRSVNYFLIAWQPELELATKVFVYAKSGIAKSAKSRKKLMTTEARVASKLKECEIKFLRSMTKTEAVADVRYRIAGELAANKVPTPALYGQLGGRIGAMLRARRDLASSNATLLRNKAALTAAKRAFAKDLGGFTGKKYTKEIHACIRIRGINFGKIEADSPFREMYDDVVAMVQEFRDILRAIYASVDRYWECSVLILALTLKVVLLVMAALSIATWAAYFGVKGVRFLLALVGDLSEWFIHARWAVVNWIRRLVRSIDAQIASLKTANPTLAAL